MLKHALLALPVGALLLTGCHGDKSDHAKSTQSSPHQSVSTSTPTQVPAQVTPPEPVTQSVVVSQPQPVVMINPVVTTTAKPATETPAQPAVTDTAKPAIETPAQPAVTDITKPATDSPAQTSAAQGTVPSVVTTSQQLPSSVALNHLQHLLLVARGVLAGYTPHEVFNDVTLQPESLLPMSGTTVSPAVVALNAGTVFRLNGANYVNDWHCYAMPGNGLTLSRDAVGMHLDGAVTAYVSDPASGQCTSTVAATLAFNNVVINDQLVIGQGSIDVNGTVLDGQALQASLLPQQVGKLFGPTWGQVQQSSVQAQLAKDASVFSLNAQGEVEAHPQGLDEPLIDFAQLDAQQLLAATLFGGAPGSGVASEKWCRIVNIPHDLSAQTLKLQSVIAVNCARSQARYCDAIESFTAGIYAAAAPLAWDDKEQQLAMDNSLLQKQKNQQGHFEAHNQLQNAFIPKFTSAIEPIFGYGEPRTDGQDNNAGANSWAGHAGHCQNTMNNTVTAFGISWLSYSDGDTTPAWWTQNFRL